MGLFDRFKKRVEEVVDATDAESLSAQEGTNEAEQALKKAEANASTPKQVEHLQSAFDESTEDEDWDDDWEDLEELESSKSSDDDWDDDWEDLDDEPASVPLSKKELKRLNKQEKKRQKELKKRGAQEAIKGGRKKQRTGWIALGDAIKQGDRGGNNFSEAETEVDIDDFAHDGNDVLLIDTRGGTRCRSSRSLDGDGRGAAAQLRADRG